MSMPSDVTDDVTEALERVDRPARPKGRGVLSQITTEQTGWFFATFVAFLGITFFGPALGRLRREPTFRARAEQKAREVRRQAERSYKKSRKRLRRLGGGAIPR